MNTINQLLNQWSQWVVGWFADWPWTLLLVVSVVSGLLMALVFRWTSNQRAIGESADRIRAQVLAIKLFQDDIGGIFRSLGQILRYTFWRLAYSLPPLVVMLVPFVLLLSQLGLWYEHGPLRPGQSTVVQLEIHRDHWKQAQRAQLRPSPGMRIEAGPMRDVGQQSIFWKVRMDSEESNGAAPLSLHWDLDGQPLAEKSIVVSANEVALEPVCPRRPGAVWWEKLLYPKEPGFTSQDPVRGVSVQYPQRPWRVLGLPIPWWLTFLVVSLLAALAAKPLFGVKF